MSTPSRIETTSITVTTLGRRPSSSHEESGPDYQDFVKIGETGNDAGSALEAVTDPGIGANEVLPPTTGGELGPQVGDVGSEQRHRVLILRPPDLHEKRPVGHEQSPVGGQHAQQRAPERQSYQLIRRRENEKLASLLRKTPPFGDVKERGLSIREATFPRGNALKCTIRLSGNNPRFVI